MKMLPSLGLILILCFQGILTEHCIQKKYGQRNIVCVCNSTYCDHVKHNAETDLLSGIAIKYTSSERGLRFHKSVERFQPLDDLNPDLIPPAKLYVNASQIYQVILGFGATLTDSAGFNIASLKKEAQDLLLRSYFTEDGIGYSLVKVPMAGTEYSNRSYTYADESGDRNLKNFKLAKEDYKYKIPFLREIKNMSERPIKLHSSVWTAPAWMKNVGLIFKQRSSLKQEYYQLWADYFIRFLQAYEKEGLKFWAMSPQNEPSHGTKWDMQPLPTAMGWANKDQRVWIKDKLVPTLAKNNYSYIKILGLDDDSSTLPKWLEEVMVDRTVRDYVSGIAIHWYSDSNKDFPGVLTRTHNKFPEKFILYNDASLGPNIHPPNNLGSWFSGEYYANHLFKVLKNWAAGWMEGNMVLNTYGGPSYVNKINDAAIIVNKTANEFYKQPTYYIIGHFSKFIPTDSIRIGLMPQYSSSTLDSLAFLTPEDTVVVIVKNSGYQDEEIEIIDPAYGFIRFTAETKSISTVIYSNKERTTTVTSTTTTTESTTFKSTSSTQESTITSTTDRLIEEIKNKTNQTDFKSLNAAQIQAKTVRMQEQTMTNTSDNKPSSSSTLSHELYRQILILSVFISSTKLILFSI